MGVVVILVVAFGVVAYVLLVSRCPFMTAAKAQEGFDSPFANASICMLRRKMSRGKRKARPPCDKILLEKKCTCQYKRPESCMDEPLSSSFATVGRYGGGGGGWHR